MDWKFIGRAADIIGILGFICSAISLILNACILSRIKSQKNAYSQRRKKLYEELSSLREIIWTDKIITPKTCDSLHTALSSMRQCFPLLLSPVCNYHIWHCIHLLKKNDFDNNQSEIRAHLNFLIARLTKKE